MALKRITPGLTDKTLVTSKQKLYSDIDLSFKVKSGSLNEEGVRQGDVFKKTDVAAVIQSVETILLTNHLEKPYRPFFGANIRSMLFELDANYSESAIREQITKAVEKDEPRAKITEVRFYSGNEQIPRGAQNIRSFADNSVYIQVEFRILNSEETFTAAVNMNRLR